MLSGFGIVRTTLGVAAIMLGFTSISQVCRAAAMDGHWSGALSGEKGSGQADIVISGQSVTYSYRGSAVPVEWSKVTASMATFGNPLFKLTLNKDGSASFVSSQFGDATGTLSRR